MGKWQSCLAELSHSVGEMQASFQGLPRRRDPDKQSKMLAEIFKHHIHGVRANLKWIRPYITAVQA